MLGFTRQASYRWRASPVSKRDWDDAHLTNAAIDAHRDDPTFGYRSIADGLHAAGLRLSERRVWRLCSQQRLWSLHAKKRDLNREAGPPVHDDRVRRAFTAPDLLAHVDTNELSAERRVRNQPTLPRRVFIYLLRTR